MAADADPVALPPWSIDPAAKSSTPPALGDLLAAPSLKWPDCLAIDDGEVNYTFAQLEQSAQTVAAWLTEQGVGAGDRVAVLAEKRAVMPVLAVAIWKCGAVYVPLDSTEPNNRLLGLLKRLQPMVVITLGDQELGSPVGRRLGKEQLAEILSGPAVSHATVARRPDEAAYIVFASGATGEPQGAEISVANLLAYFGNHNEILRITPESRVLSMTPFHFDVSLEDTLLPLSLGAFVYQFRSLSAGAVIRSVIARKEITHLIAVTMLLNMITGDGRQISRTKLPSLELVMTGAQVCDPGVLQVWTRGMPDTRIVQAFGPPEATIFSFTYEIEREEAERMAACPVGRPLRGMQAKIIRNGVEIHDSGAQGELWVGGVQVMRGYFDQPEETARLVVEMDGTRFFRTGDICSYDGDGNIVFHQHDDECIAWLAGRRTHLSEVYRAASNCSGVDRILTSVVQRDNRDLVALVVESAKRQVVTNVADHLRGILPEYMCPTLMVWSPATSDKSTEKRDDRKVLQQLTKVAQQSNSNYFVVSSDGSLEIIDEV
ncbi:amino acid adenylation domain-containing protein [Actinopolyspora xinjiangensis]|uniref:Amino acid adenylation domain-containing protein n=1 Tax=Actinopolyspora xinjiangensis TaxID=405564 RepID=A0A1H0WYF1_9ACTN|nr:AMP-binding protein [Actinopolyspora xinjiangensis]SDP95650.1 amino acid adenylation domain-containing protein [Actinopolyspora xinjiangensis]